MPPNANCCLYGWTYLYELMDILFVFEYLVEISRSDFEASHDYYRVHYGIFYLLKHVFLKLKQFIWDWGELGQVSPQV